MLGIIYLSIGLVYTVVSYIVLVKVVGKTMKMGYFILEYMLFKPFLWTIDLSCAIWLMTHPNHIITKEGKKECFEKCFEDD
jgi:hypothetical protein